MQAPFVNPIESAPRAHLSRLFDEEATLWTQGLLWSFAPTRKRLEAALDDGVLNGFVASDPHGICAYATYASDGEHGIVGSLFAAPRCRTLGIEALLARHVLDRLFMEEPRVIDCQTLFSSDPGLTEPFTVRGFVSAKRLYMTLERAAWFRARRDNPPGFRSKPTHRTDLRSMARLIYEAHVESHGLDASSSFDTLESCERILRQIILDEVCGPFDSYGSRRVEQGGRIVAASLLTWPLPEVAHISEVATTPSHRRLGLARRCITETLTHAFETGQATAATLSVTASNHAAVALYESLGFVPHVRYGSHVRRGARR